jgi:hypothetical protein
MLCVSFGKAGVIEHEPGTGAIIEELEPRDRIDAGRPIGCPPGLNDSPVRDDLDNAPTDVAAENGKRTARLATDS